MCSLLSRMTHCLIGVAGTCTGMRLFYWIKGKLPVVTSWRKMTTLSNWRSQEMSQGSLQKGIDNLCGCGLQVGVGLQNNWMSLGTEEPLGILSLVWANFWFQLNLVFPGVQWKTLWALGLILNVWVSFQLCGIIENICLPTIQKSLIQNSAVFPLSQVFAAEGLKLTSNVQTFSKQVIHVYLPRASGFTHPHWKHVTNT